MTSMVGKRPLVLRGVYGMCLAGRDHGRVPNRTFVTLPHTFGTWHSAGMRIWCATIPVLICAALAIK